MQLFNVLTAGIAFIFATVSAFQSARELDILSKQFSGKSFELTSLNVDRVAAANVTMSFSIYNPDPLSNVTADCTGTWLYGSGGWPSTIYQSCLNGADSSFGWHMKDFVTWTNFSLELKDTFRDPQVGDPPYDRVTIFGKADFSENVVHCKPYNDASEYCAQVTGSTVMAPIDRSIAKHR